MKKIGFVALIMAFTSFGEGSFPPSGSLERDFVNLSIAQVMDLQDVTDIYFLDNPQAIYIEFSDGKAIFLPSSYGGISGGGYRPSEEYPDSILEGGTFQETLFREIHDGIGGGG